MASRILITYHLLRPYCVRKAEGGGAPQQRYASLGGRAADLNKKDKRNASAGFDAGAGGYGTALRISCEVRRPNYLPLNTSYLLPATYP